MHLSAPILAIIQLFSNSNVSFYAIKAMLYVCLPTFCNVQIPVYSSYTKIFYLKSDNNCYSLDKLWYSKKYFHRFIESLSSWWSFFIQTNNVVFGNRWEMELMKRQDIEIVLHKSLQTKWSGSLYRKFSQKACTWKYFMSKWVYYLSFLK